MVTKTDKEKLSGLQTFRNNAIEIYALAYCEWKDNTNKEVRKHAYSTMCFLERCVFNDASTQKEARKWALKIYNLKQEGKRT